MSEQPYVLVLGTAEWNQAIATNQHYVVRELCRDGFARVDFVESLGLRTPQFSRRDLTRIWGRLKRIVAGRGTRDSLSSQRVRPEGMTVISPLVIPFHGSILRPLNRWLLRRAVHVWLSSPQMKVLWTYSPVTYGLEDEATATFYHCVDLLGMVPGIDNDLIEKSERRLATKGVRAAATSEAVQSHLQQMGFSGAHLWKNVADVETIAAASPEQSTRVVGRVMFAGNLTPNKVDFTLLEALADAGLDVRVAGPHAEGGGDDSSAFDSLIAHGVTYLGMLSLPELAEELVTATVGLIPYKINAYTRGVSPLKTFEYLAAGLAVVSSPIPSVVAVDGHVSILANTRVDQWLDAVTKLSTQPSPADIAARLAIARKNSWSSRGISVREVVSVQ